MPAEANEHVVETANLTKVFRDFWRRPKVRAVDKLSLQVRRGEVFGLLGPNGSGKSTTMKLLLGLLFPTSGAIRVLGRPPRDVRVKNRIGFLPEETYLYPYLDAEETLDFFARLHRFSRRERRRRVGALIEMVGLAGARHRPLREYSKGMARRIGMAQALINDPELILLDEPTTGLDPIGTREVKDLLVELKQRGKTILLCSHLLADVEDVCDRIGILYGGRLCALGEVGELLSKRQLTQITVPDLSPEGLERIEQLIQESTGTESIEVGHPLDRLENYFLRVVREAREAQPETAGVEAGRFEPSLFQEVARPATPGEVIERLTTPVAPAEPEAEEREEAATPAAPEPDVLERLTTVTPAPAPGAEAQTEPPAPAEKEAGEEERRSLIDRLVHKPDNPSGEDQNKP